MSKLRYPFVNNGRVCLVGNYLNRSDNTNYTVFVFENDRCKEPCFQIIDTETKGEKFCSSILIKKPKYLYKTEKCVLDYHDARNLNVFFNCWCSVWKKTYWEVLIQKWNNGNKRKIKNMNVKTNYLEIL